MIYTEGFLFTIKVIRVWGFLVFVWKYKIIFNDETSKKNKYKELYF